MHVNPVLPASAKAVIAELGFDPDDALYLMGPLAWLGWLGPILVAASAGSTVAMLILGIRLLRLR